MNVEVNDFIIMGEIRKDKLYKVLASYHFGGLSEILFLNNPSFYLQFWQHFFISSVNMSKLFGTIQS